MTKGVTGGRVPSVQPHHEPFGADRLGHRGWSGSHERAAQAAAACADKSCFSFKAGTAGLNSQPCIWLHPS